MPRPTRQDPGTHWLTAHIFLPSPINPKSLHNYWNSFQGQAPTVVCVPFSDHTQTASCRWAMSFADIVGSFKLLSCSRTLRPRARVLKNLWPARHNLSFWLDPTWPNTYGKKQYGKRTQQGFSFVRRVSVDEIFQRLVASKNTLDFFICQVDVKILTRKMHII